MPAQVTDIKQFLEIARRKDAKGSISPSRYPEPAPRKHFFSARLKKSEKSKDIKMKIRCKRYVYTLILKDSDKADKIKQSLPPTMPFQEISKKTKKPKKA
ncbi:hypothetical protein KCU88_g2437, partial [Aureobasidium melanogenum]